MKSEASYRISRKTLKLKRAFSALIRSILDHPTVEKIFGIALLIYWGIGFLGLAWMVIAGGAFFVSGFKADEGSIVDWLRDFSVACPGLASLWLAIAVSTAWMLLHDWEKQKKQVEESEPKAQ